MMLRHVSFQPCVAVAVVLLAAGLFSGRALAEECRLTGALPDTWQSSLDDYGAAIENNRPSNEAFNRAKASYTAELDAFDPLKPGDIYDAVLRLSVLESGITAFRYCSDIGRAKSGITPAGGVPLQQWLKTLSDDSDAFFRIYGTQWQQAVFDDRSDNPLAPENHNIILVYISPVLRNSLKKVRPELMSRVSQAFETSLASTDIGKDELADAKGREQYMAAVYRQGAIDVPDRDAIRAKAIKTLPKSVNGWVLSSDLKYSRQAAEGIRMELSCSRPLSRGLVLWLERPSGKFLYGSNDNVVANLTEVTLTLDGQALNGRALLEATETTTSKGWKYGEEVDITTTLYDASHAFLTFQSGVGAGQDAANVINGTAKATTEFTHTMASKMGMDMGRQDEPNAMELIMGGLADLSKAAIPYRINNFEIDDVKTAKSALLEVTLDGPQGVHWVNLGDISPQAAPFTSLMRACHGEE